MGRFNGRPAVILLVEDDPGDRELTRRALKGGKIRNDFRTVADGEEALEYLQRRGRYKDAVTSPRPDLILLGLNMPKLDGRQVLHEIRADANLRGIPVVVLTTSKRDEDVVFSYDLGANSYVTMPVGIDEFTRTIKSLANYWFQIVALPQHAR